MVSMVKEFISELRILAVVHNARARAQYARFFYIQNTVWHIKIGQLRYQQFLFEVKNTLRMPIAREREPKLEKIMIFPCHVSKHGIKGLRNSFLRSKLIKNAHCSVHACAQSFRSWWLVHVIKINNVIKLVVSK